MMGVDWSLLMTWMLPPPLPSIPSARLGGEELSVVFKERSPEALECIQTGSYPDGMGGGLIGGLKQVEQVVI